MDKLITFCLSYYNQPKAALMRHIEHWRGFPGRIKNKLTFYIIDDCSRVPASELLNWEDLDDLDIHLYRVKEDLYWNAAGVQNLAAKECNTTYMLILDIDTVVNRRMAKKLIKLAGSNNLNPIAFKFTRKVIGNRKHEKHNKFHPKVCLIRREDYWRVGGFEEDLVGHYGYTDPIFWYRAKGILEVSNLSNVNLLYYPDGGVESERDSSHNKKLYEQKKLDNSWSTDYVRFDWERVF